MPQGRSMLRLLQTPAFNWPRYFHALATFIATQKLTTSTHKLPLQIFQAQIPNKQQQHCLVCYGQAKQPSSRIELMSSSS